MLHNCQKAREFTLEAAEFSQEYAVTISFICFTIIKWISIYFNRRVVPRFSAYEHWPPQIKEEVGLRCVQLLFGTLIAITGYTFVLYQAESGCHVNEVYMSWVAGPWLIAFEAHEFIRSWPLRAPVLAHHLVVLVTGLSYLEWQILPAPPGQPVHWNVVLLVANLGLGWVSDFFHVLYRTSSSLLVIEKFQKTVLGFLRVIRLVNVALIGHIMYQAAQQQRSYPAVAAMGFVALAYLYNNHASLSFARNFDSERYFSTHQLKWTHQAKLVVLTEEESSEDDDEREKDESVAPLVPTEKKVLCDEDVDGEDEEESSVSPTEKDEEDDSTRTENEETEQENAAPNNEDNEPSSSAKLSPSSMRRRGGRRGVMSVQDARSGVHASFSRHSKEKPENFFLGILTEGQQPRESFRRGS